MTENMSSQEISTDYMSSEKLSELHHFMSPVLEDFEEKEDEEDEEELFYEGIPTLKDGQVYACVCCDFTTSQDNLLMSHFESHMGPDPFDISEKIGLENVLKCKYCPQTFQNLQTLVKHECAHEEGKRYECSFCLKKFKNQTSMKIHERTHTGVRQFECRFCKKTFTWPSGLKVHERIHTGEKPYKCAYCDKTFTQGTSCKIHERTHTGYKPFKCSVCDYSSASTQNLNKHLKARHPEVFLNKQD